MTTENPVAVKSPLEAPVRPRAWLYENVAGAVAVHTNTERVRFEADMRAAREHPDAHTMTPLYDQAALDAVRADERQKCVECIRRFVYGEACWAEDCAEAIQSEGAWP